MPATLSRRVNQNLPIALTSIGHNGFFWNYGMSNYVMLLVEDDALQREMLSALLRDEGFEVVECATAEAAELILASTDTELRALVTDNNLAGSMTGAELAHFARQRHPNLNIIVMSGRQLAPLPAGAVFLSKPFAPRLLLEAVAV